MQSVTRIGERSRSLKPGSQAATGLRRVHDGGSDMGFRDTAFLIGYGLALVTAGWVYGLTGWAVPVLIDRHN